MQFQIRSQKKKKKREDKKKITKFDLSAEFVDDWKWECVDAEWTDGIDGRWECIELIVERKL